jgi:hypothetical protein
MPKSKFIQDDKPEATEPQEPVPAPAQESTAVLICLGGFNLCAKQSGDTVEIPVASLPKTFSLQGITRGYFPTQPPRRFNIVEHSLDEKKLRVKITPHA